MVQPELQRRRHARKYSEGELGEDRSFYFRGPESALCLRVQNLSLFLQIAAGVDDRTWLNHLRAEDYSAWIRDAIKDADLADEIAAVERGSGLSAADSRDRIKEAVDRRYTGPASEAPVGTPYRANSSPAATPIAPTLAATTAVAIQPPSLSGIPIVKSPIMRGWAAIHIMTASTGAATMPLMTALQ